jgi:hypothetical protein
MQQNCHCIPARTLRGGAFTENSPKGERPRPWAMAGNPSSKSKPQVSQFSDCPQHIGLPLAVRPGSSKQEMVGIGRFGPKPSPCPNKVDAPYVGATRTRECVSHGNRYCTLPGGGFCIAPSRRRRVTWNCDNAHASLCAIYRSSGMHNRRAETPRGSPAVHGRRRLCAPFGIFSLTLDSRIMSMVTTPGTATPRPCHSCFPISIP